MQTQGFVRDRSTGVGLAWAADKKRLSAEATFDARSYEWELPWAEEGRWQSGTWQPRKT